MKVFVLMLAIAFICTCPFVLALETSGELPTERLSKLARLETTKEASDSNPHALEDSADLPRRRESLAATVTLRAIDSWTNSTFASLLCGNVSSETTSLTILGSTAVFLLPDCFYGLAFSIKTFAVANIIIQGSSTTTDPLQRLATAISATPTFFRLSACYLLTYSGSKAIVNWSAITTITSSVNTFELIGAGIGTGSTIPTLPKALTTLTLSNAGFGGPLPSPLFASAAVPSPTIFTCSLGANPLTGSIPDDFFSHIDFSAVTNIIVNMQQTQLTGSFPIALFAGSLPSATFISLTLSNSQFTGPINNPFASTTFNTAILTSFAFFSNYNNFSGPLPTWLNAAPALSTYTFGCVGCTMLDPSLSTAILGVSSRPLGCSIFVYLDSCSFTNITPTFFIIHTPPSSLEVSLKSNQLQSLPMDLFSRANFSRTATVKVYFSSNKLTGNVPISAGLYGDLTSLSSCIFDFSLNPTFAGTVPSTFLQSIAGAVTGVVTNTISVTLVVSNTSLTGALPLPQYNFVPNMRFTISAKFANFTSLDSPEGNQPHLVSAYLDNNPLLAGALSSSFFLDNPNLAIFSAPNTRLQGLMPDMNETASPDLGILNLASTSIDFCGVNRSAWASSKLTTCNLDATSAYYCRGLYPTACTFSEPLAPSASPSTPGAILPAPAGCLASTRPSSEWACVDGTWTFSGTVNSTVITIPSGATTTTIKGNLTSSTVIINGLNSVLIIEGCTSNTTILVELTPAQLEEIGKNGKLQQLLSLSNASSCNSSLSDVTIGTRIKGSSCKKVSVSKVPSSNGALTGLFKIDTGSCNKWWIILVSVLCAVVVVGLVVAIVAFTIHKTSAERRAKKSLQQG